jgi:hypothetical protein
VDHRACAHRTGFHRDEEIAVGKTIIPECLSGFSHGDDFGVGGGVVRRDGAVAAAPEDSTFVHDDRANGHFSGALSADTFA